MDAMTDVKCELYVDDEYVDFTDYMTAFSIADKNITAVPTATVNLFGELSNFSSYLASPYCLAKISVKPASSWYRPFFGYVHCPYRKVIPGVLGGQTKLSLDCCGHAQRLATDNITYDYYALQSTITPHTGTEDVWTYRRMIQDFLDYPDSIRDGTGLNGTGFEVSAALNANGIDHAIDASCTWTGQSLLEAIRTTLDTIGYDGYYMSDDQGAPLPPLIVVAPFNRASIATLTDPFIGEPEYCGGDINDVANAIFVTGGIDAGVPVDGDRWTEYGYGKYSPAIWSCARTSATNTIMDEANGVLANPANTQCLRFSTTGSTETDFTVTLNLANTEYGLIDALNRITGLTFTMKLFTNYASVAPQGAQLPYRRNTFILEDDEGNQVGYRQSDFYEVADDSAAERSINITIGADVEIANYGDHPQDQWYYVTNDTSFDWEHISYLIIKSDMAAWTANAGVTWGFWLDGLQFTGGYQIAPFQSYSQLLNAPSVDSDSVNWFGVHVLEHNNAALNSFEQAKAEGARLLANLKNPIPYWTLTKSDPNAALLPPSSVVTYSSTDYRIAEMNYDWTKAKKRCNVTYKLIGKTSPLPPLWTQVNELRFIVR
jgi:hypothetical protein